MLKSFNRQTIAIIPARAGSKRIPDKNKILLGGKPLIHYSIQFAKNNSKYLDRVIVSTDDAEIKELALEQGVEVIDRPEELAGDKAPTLAVLKQVVNSLEDDRIDSIVLLQPTNPLRPKNLLKRAITEFENGGHESLMSVSRNHQKFGKLNKNTFKPYNYEMGQRSQDLDPLYYENGLLYIFKTELILSDKTLGEKNFALIEDHPFSKIDIDTYEDLEYAEFLLSKYKKEIFNR